VLSIVLVGCAALVAARLAHVLYRRVEHRTDEAMRTSRHEGFWLSILLVACIGVLAVEYGGDAAKESQVKAVERREQQKISHEEYLRLMRSVPVASPTPDAFYATPTPTPIYVAPTITPIPTSSSQSNLG
jgi:hypothetical protein